jgi:hypothetical protein
LKKDNQTSSSLSSSSIQYAVARYDREPQGPTEISIKKGDILVVEKEDVEWWFGSIFLRVGTNFVAVNEKKGFFPGNYVKLLKESNLESLIAVSESITKTVSIRVPSNPDSISTVSSTLKLPKGYKKDKAAPSLDGRSHSLEPMDKNSTSMPIWHHILFLDLFTDPFKRSLVTKDHIIETPVSIRIRYACYVVRSALLKLDLNEETNENVKAVLHHALKVFSEGVDLCEKFPADIKDATRYFTFLTTVVSRIRSLTEQDSIMFPSSWVDEEGVERGVMLIVTKTSDSPDEYSVCVVNCDVENGLAYHPSNVNNDDGKVTRNIAMDLCKIPADKATNAAFW